MPDRDDTAPVEYRLVVGFPEYRLGSDGSAWSCKTRVGRGKGKGWTYVAGPTWRRLRPPGSPGGHLHIDLCRDGKVYPKNLHRLILEHFVGPCPPGMEACHNDGNPANNALANLRWDTHVANLNDKIVHGTFQQGERHGMSKLTDDQVRSIRTRFAAGGITQSKIAAGYGVDQTLVSMIVRRKIWTHVE